jgi:RNase H-like domain found in reverse transcriptase/Reverse transcriptase (RNA-dependent DNA polymerase)
MPSKLWRVVEDYRQLNKVIVDDVFDPPSVDEIIGIIGSKNKFFCSVDLRQGYHHILFKVSDHEKTCFSTGGLAGKLQYPVLPYGSKHGGQIFQRTKEKILHILINVCCLVYVGDILIFGENIENMIKNLDLVLGRIATEGGSIDLEKSRFLAEEIDFLGHTIGKGGLSATNKGVSALVNYKRPRNKKEMLSFLGLASFERKYVPNFAGFERVLRNIMVTYKKHLVWSDEENDSFEKLKAELAKQYKLAHFDNALETIILCDASGTCLGAVLTQIQSNGDERVLQYASRTLSKVEQRFSNTKRELFAIVWAVTKSFVSMPSIEV